MITLAEAKVYLKVEPNVTEDDALISALIQAASEYISNATGNTALPDEFVAAGETPSIVV